MKLLNTADNPLWLLILPVAFWVYATSFCSFPVLEKQHSILGESDAAAFIVLITDFSMERVYGDPYRLDGRRLEDVAQKHKIHHILYVMLASVLYQLLASVYSLLGLPAKQAVYAINAVLGCMNIYFLFILLKQIDPEKKSKGIFLLLYAFSLSSWIFHSVPESWPFSATLLLLFLVLHYNRRMNPIALSIYVGIAMLNNVFLGTLCFFLIISFWVTHRSLKPFLTKSVMSIVIAIVSWLGSMFLLSLFDEGFRPDHYFHYTTWFKQHIAPPIIIFDSYFWKVALSQLYITSIVSNQSVPNVPQESLLYTIQQSRFGLFATAVYLCLFLAIGWQALKQVFYQLKCKGGFDELLSSVDFPMGLYAIAWVFLTVIMDTLGAFLYSTMVMPMIVAVFYRYTDWNRWDHKILWASTLCVVLANNALQIMIFRNVLTTMVQ